MSNKQCRRRSIDYLMDVVLLYSTLSALHN